MMWTLSRINEDTEQDLTEQTNKVDRLSIFADVCYNNVKGYS